MKATHYVRKLQVAILIAVFVLALIITRYVAADKRRVP